MIPLRLVIGPKSVLLAGSSHHAGSPPSCRPQTRQFAARLAPTPPPLVTAAWLASALAHPSKDSARDGGRVIPLDASWYRPQRLRSVRPGQSTAQLEAEDEEAAWYARAAGWDTPEWADDEVSAADAKRDPAREFVEVGRLPTARFFDHSEISDPLNSVPLMTPTVEDFEESMTRLGIAEEDHLVFYDTAGISTAPRGYWMLKAMGHRRVSVLDGGFPAWLSEGRPVETGPISPPSSPDSSSARPPSPADAAPASPPPPRRFQARPDAALAVDHATLLRQALDYNRASFATVVDGRPAGRFRPSSGSLLKGAGGVPREWIGHVPGAVNVDWRTVVDARSRRMRTMPEIVEVFERRGVDLGKPVVVMGHDAMTASVLFLALQVAGKTADVSVYEGGWVEYAGKKSSVVRTF
ncbi:Rhodanese-like domain-containing protein [Zopfochytrium polystomum]|nr:Rhodanese-like domain-containing protein [Zopfochytrium polystomum]